MLHSLHVESPLRAHAQINIFTSVFLKFLFCDFLKLFFNIFHRDHEVCSPLPVIYSSSAPVWELPLLCKCRVFERLGLVSLSGASPVPCVHHPGLCVG